MHRYQTIAVRTMAFCIISFRTTANNHPHAIPCDLKQRLDELLSDEN